jgi:hypothetical protein
VHHPIVSIQERRSRRRPGRPAELRALPLPGVVAALTAGTLLAAFSIVAALVSQPVLAALAGTTCVGVLRAVARRLLR